MAYCSNCGIKLNDNVRFCSSCGSKVAEFQNLDQNPYSPPQFDSVPITKNIQILTNAELRASARKQLQGVWGQMALAFLVYYSITIIPGFIFSDYSEYGFYSPIYNNLLDTIINIAIFVISGPLFLGISGYVLKRTRNEEINIENIFDGFKRFFPSFLLVFFSTLFILLWSLLLIIPGIIKGLGYSMAVYIMYDNPEISSLEALKRSQIMMKGYKGKLFCLYLSFIGWGLLCLLTLGIGFLWLAPYYYLADANFYENLKKNQEQAELQNI